MPIHTPRSFRSFPLAAYALAYVLGAAGLPGCRDSASPPPPTRDVRSDPTTARVAPASRASPVVVNFRLYKFMQEVGSELDTHTAVGDGADIKAVSAFRDRSSTVALAASYQLGPEGAVRRYQAWGRTARSSTIDDDVEAMGEGVWRVRQGEAAVRQAKPAAAPVAASGYAPVLAQDLLVRAWIQRGRPKSMPLLPEGEVTISSLGRETYKGEAGQDVALEHLAVTGLVWGREDIWLDASGHLVALVTRDAEFDPFAAMRDDHATLLPALVAKAAHDGVVALAALTARATPTRTAAAAPIAIVGGRLIDGTGRSAVADAVVVIDGARIAAAGPRASTPIPAGAVTVDAAGKSILPGLWDMHAHMSQVEQGLAYLAAGVTTVRDLGNVLEFITSVRDTIDAGKGLGPRVLVAGLVDGPGQEALGTIRIKTAADIAPVLDRLVAAGCLQVKIYQHIPPALVKPIATAAHARGLRVAGHVPTGMNAIEAIGAGFDEVTHLPNLLTPLLPVAEMQTLSRAERLRRVAAIDLSSPPAKKILDLVAAKRIVVDDTLALYELLLHPEQANAAAEPGLAKQPPALRAAHFGIEPPLAPAAAAAFDKYIALLGELHRRGVPIVAGTDIAVPGHTVHRQLELYVRAGFTPMQALQAATLVPARVMQLEREVGTIEPGKRADLILVAGDPLTDIRAVRNVSTVFAAGKSYDPATLWQLAEFTP